MQAVGVNDGRAAIGLSLVLLALAGCSAIPNDGPSGRSIAAASSAPVRAGYLLVNLDYGVTQAVASVPRKFLLGLANADSDAPENLIRAGDALAVSIYEPSGASLFSASGNDATLSSSNPGLQNFPTVTVDADGYVDLPFAGKVHVADAAPETARARIHAALRGRVIDPQVLVQVVSSSANSVSVLGEVRNVGRFRLAPSSDRLLDVVAEAGGPVIPYQDIDIEVVRGGQTFSVPMAQVMEDGDQNIRLAPRDQLRLLPNERKYSVLGALGRVTQTSITDAHVSLAAAISRAGGLDTWTANDTYVFVFRFERPEVVSALGLSGAPTPKGVPTVYRLDMSNPSALLVADDLEIQNGDLIYVPRAGLVTVSKFMQIVNAIAQAGYSVKVTGVP